MRVDVDVDVEGGCGRSGPDQPSTDKVRTASGMAKALGKIQVAWRATNSVTIDFGPNIAVCHTSRTRDHNVQIQEPYILSYLLHKNSYKYSFSVCPFFFSRKATLLQFPR